MNCWIIVRMDPEHEATHSLGPTVEQGPKNWRPDADWDIKDEYLGEDLFIREPTGATYFSSRAAAEAVAARLAELDDEPNVYRVLPRTGDVWTRRLIKNLGKEEWAVGVVVYIDEYRLWFALEWASGVYDPPTDKEGYRTAASAKRAIDQWVSNDSSYRADGPWKIDNDMPWTRCRTAEEAEEFLENAEEILRG